MCQCKMCTNYFNAFFSIGHCHKQVYNYVWICLYYKQSESQQDDLFCQKTRNNLKQVQGKKSENQKITI